MWILALDTSTREGSVAVARDGDVVATATGDPSRTHGERLPGDLLAVAGEAGVALSGIDRFAVSSGPGSFTSLRVGLATVQALALVHARPVIQVSTLDALARTPGSGDLVLSWMDGQRRDVFAALYERGTRKCIAGPRVGSPTDILQAWKPLLAERRLTVVGDAVTVTRTLLVDLTGPATTLVGDPPPLAPVIARVALERLDQAIAPHAVQPLYIRRPDAVIARERGS